MQACTGSRWSRAMVDAAVPWSISGVIKEHKVNTVDALAPPAVVSEDEAGCMVCDGQNDVDVLLICDICDRYCHTYAGGRAWACGGRGRV